MNTIIAANSQQQPQQPAFAITLESTGIFLGILVSVSMLTGIAIKMVSKFNAITNEIRDLREDFNSHSTVIADVKTLQLDVIKLDKRLDIHLQDYVNYKDATLLNINGNKELIGHKWKRTEEEFEKRDEEIKELKKRIS